MNPIRLQAGLFLSLIVTAAGLSGCSNSVMAPAIAAPACPGYSINTQDITVLPGGGTFNVSATNATRLVFDAGAVSASASYHVEATTFQGKQVAGVRITPNTGAPTTFGANVHLRVGYAECSWANTTARFVVARVENGALRSLGGTESAAEHWVEVTLDHFSDYIIAD